jgi:CheY-like chemotaxis protein
MKKIVVVDRNPHIRRLVQRELSSEGHTVYAPESEPEFMDILNRKDHVDLLIIDPAVIDDTFSHASNHFSDFFKDVPVIVHSLTVYKEGIEPFSLIVGRIEKNWDSINEIDRKSVV